MSALQPPPSSPLHPRQETSMLRFRILAVAALAVVAAACSSNGKSDGSKATSSFGRSQKALATDLSITASNTTPAVGAQVDVQLSAPVHNDASLIGQTLEATFDKSKLTL